MKKALCVLLTSVLLLGLWGCKEQKALSQEEILRENVWPDEQNNSVFTDDFFADVVKIGSFPNGWVSGDEMKPVIRYLKSLTLTETKEFFLSATDEEGREVYGANWIDFIKSDGTQITFRNNHAALSGYDANGEQITYVIQEGNIISGLREAFALGLNGGDQ